MATIESFGYSVCIGDNALSLLGEKFEGENYLESTFFILVDENTKKFCLPILIDKIPFLNKASVVETSSGEINKNIDTCVNIWNYLSERNANRKAVLINLGGGVIGDMGGFVASTYKRGIEFVQIPTTLLSQVDSSVGGKLGVDLSTLKNQIGVFNYPSGVYIFPYFLKTLPSNQIISGFAEILKHGLIRSRDYWKKLKEFNFRNYSAFTEVICESVGIKNNIVLEDPKESGIRKLLNFGHTIGHAVESWFLTNKPEALLHGEAIAIGMICETYLSKLKGNLGEDEVDEIVNFILSVFPHPKIPERSFKDLLKLMKNDKKNKDKGINFTLLKKIGEGIHDQVCDENEILESISFYNKWVMDLNK